MLSLFPEILFLSPFAPLIIRVALALLMLYDGYVLLGRSQTQARVAALCSFIVAALFFVGAWTQLAAILFAVAFLVYLIFPYGPGTSMPRSTIALAIVMALTLVLTGPGAYAFDLPL